MFVILFVVLATILGAIYVSFKWKGNAWKRRGVLQAPDGIVLLGHVKDIVLMRRSAHEVYHEMYLTASTDEPALGYYEMRRLALLVRSFSLAKKILDDEFHSFHRNDWYHEPSDLILNNHPSFAKTIEKWTYLRNVGNHLKTPEKLRRMVTHLVTCCNQMIDHLSENSGRLFRVSDVSVSYATDSSITCIYGLHSDSFSNSNCVFKKINEKLFDVRSLPIFTKIFTYFFPRIGETFNMTVTPTVFSDFYLKTVTDSIKYRAKYEIEVTMFDFLQLLMELNEKDEHLNFNLEEMTGHTLTLLSESYGTTSVALTHVLDLLSTYTEVQAELRREIDEYIHSKDDVTYEALEHMLYLNAFVAEMLRLRPPIPVLSKVCTRDCILEEADKKYPVKVGERLTIPVYSMHTDSRYFPDPLTFDPERFINVDEESVQGYLPFGLGSRACQGRKFAMLQIKTFIVALLKNFRIVRHKIEDKSELDETQVYYFKIKGNISIRFIRLDDDSLDERLI